MKITEATILVFDTETTGIDTAKDRIVELGAVEVRGGQRGTTMRSLLNPGIPIPEEASKVHGIRDEDVARAPSFAAIGPRFITRVEAVDVLCGFNAVRFDAPLVNAEMERHGVAGFVDPVQIVDPFLWLRRRHWHLPRSLGAVCERFGINLDNAHSATGDVLATAQLLLAMVREGIIPAEVERALEGQDRIVQHMAREEDRWGHWLYVDAVGEGHDAPPRVAIGKHRGAPLGEVDKGFIEWALARPDVHDGAARAFRLELDRRAGA